MKSFVCYQNNKINNNFIRSGEYSDEKSCFLIKIILVIISLGLLCYWRR